MPQLDLHNIVKNSQALNIQSITTNTTTVGNIVDTNGYEGCEFVFDSGVLDATTVFTPLIEYGDMPDLSDATPVPLQWLIGTINVVEPLPSYGTPISDPIGDVTFNGVADSNKPKRIGYVGHKRYVRVSEVTTLATTGGIIGCVCLLGFAHMVSTPKDV